MRAKTPIEQRIQVRAYYLSLANPDRSPLNAWLAAETIETLLAARRSEAAKKGAATKRQFKAVMAFANAPVDGYRAPH